MLNRFWQSLRSLMSEPCDTRMLPTCDLGVTDVARIDLLMQELKSSSFALVVQSEQSVSPGFAVLVAHDAESLTLQLDAANSVFSQVKHRVNLIGSSTHGVLLFTLDLMRIPGAGLWRGDRPAELLCVQSRRHRRVRIVGDLGHRATLSLLLPFGQVRLLDLSEEGARLCMAGPVGIGTRIGGALLSLDGCAIQIAQVRVCHCSRRGDAWQLGVALEEIGPDDQRTVRRWLNEAECLARVET